jgi:hypothetical protein
MSLIYSSWGVAHSWHWWWAKGNCTGLFKMIVGVLTTCHTQYTWDKSICIFLFNRTTLQVFVTYLTGAVYVHPLWFYKPQHDNRVHSKLFLACQRWWFQWRFWFIPSVPGYLREEEEHKPDPWRNPIQRNHMGLHLENEVTKLLKPRQSFWITLYVNKGSGKFINVLSVYFMTL